MKKWEGNIWRNKEERINGKCDKKCNKKEKQLYKENGTKEKVSRWL